MEKFIAKLSGENEVPPVETEAFGMAKFITNKQESKIKFYMEVHEIEHFYQAHMHFGAGKENGPVLAFLFGADLLALEDQNGISTRRGIVTGVITDADIVENNVGVNNISELLELMRKKLTYVNAHTKQNPDGEIRGQVFTINN